MIQRAAFFVEFLRSTLPLARPLIPPHRFTLVLVLGSLLSMVPARGQLDPDLVLYYRLDVQNGTTVDNLGTLGTDGTLLGGASYTASQPGGYGTAFLGNRTGANTGRIDTGLTATQLGLAGDSWTMMAWVRWNGVSGGEDHMVFGMDKGNGNQLHNGIRANGTPSVDNVHLGMWGSGDVSDAGTVPFNTWTHVAFSRSPANGGTNSVYVNGVLTKDESNTPGVNGWAGDTVMIGYSGRGGDGQLQRGNRRGQDL